MKAAPADVITIGLFFAVMFLAAFAVAEYPTHEFERHHLEIRPRDTRAL